VFKWVLVLFGLTALTLIVVAKVITFLDPPRRGGVASAGGARDRSRSLALRRVERALVWTILIPAGLALALLVMTLVSGWGR